ncbi:MAG TPA: sigma-70 family RNA polymerase sigma factor [Polyangiaceae bacterium]|nr:sigma-70 family RNA polymerase sigma factor [Polyangiaceae bacterium]
MATWVRPLCRTPAELDEALTRERTSALSEATRLRECDPAAPRPLDLESVYASQREFVWLTLQRMGVRRSDLEDVFQDVFMIVHRRLHTYRADAKLSAWLYGICLRCAARHRRRAFHRREHPADVEPEAGLWPSSMTAPDQRLDARQRQERLNQLLDVLDAEHRSMVVMYEIEELSCAQIAELTGVKLGTIHSRLHTARRKLAAAAQRLKGDSR